jgi:hypothetical protein
MKFAKRKTKQLKITNTSCFIGYEREEGIRLAEN